MQYKQHYIQYIHSNIYSTQMKRQRSQHQNRGLLSGPATPTKTLLSGWQRQSVGPLPHGCVHRFVLTCVCVCMRLCVCV